MTGRRESAWFFSQAKGVFRLDLEGEACGKLQGARQAVGAGFLGGSEIRHGKDFKVVT